MALFASVLRQSKSKFAIDHTPHFFLGADSHQELVDFLARYLDIYNWAQHPSEPFRYVKLPKHLHSIVKVWGIEVLKLSDFDRRICQSGGGIPSVQSYLDDVKGE